MAYYQAPFSNNGRGSQSSLNDHRRSQNASTGSYNFYEDQVDANELVDHPRWPHYSGSYPGTPVSEGHDISEGHYDISAYGPYPPSPMSDYKRSSVPASGRSEYTDDDTLARLHQVPEHATPPPFSPHKSWVDAFAADIVDPNPPSSASEYPEYEDRRVRKILLRTACALITIFIISLIVILAIGIVNYEKCKNLSYLDSRVFSQDIFIDSAPNGGNWNFSQSGIFFEAIMNVHDAKSTNNSIHVQTHMISMMGGDVYAVENSAAGQYTFFHETPVRSPDWKNYLTFPPVCAKVQVDLWYPSTPTFKFVLDEYGFTVSHVN